MEVRLLPRARKFGYVGDVDAFCGPCWHNATSHAQAYGRKEPLCWECPGSKPDYDADSCVGGIQRAWWDVPGGDPSLEGWTCPTCKTVDEGKVA